MTIVEKRRKNTDKFLHLTALSIKFQQLQKMFTNVDNAEFSISRTFVNEMK